MKTLRKVRSLRNTQMQRYTCPSAPFRFGAIVAGVARGAQIRAFVTYWLFYFGGSWYQEKSQKV